MSRRPKVGRNYQREQPSETVNSKWNEAIETISKGVGVETDQLITLSELPLHHLKLEFHEIEQHLLLLGGHLSLAGCIDGNAVTINTADTSRSYDENSIQQMCLAFCKILSKTLNKTDATLTMHGFRDLMRLVMQWTEQCLQSSQLCPLTIESVNAQAAILNSYKQSIPGQMRRTLVSVLSTAITKYRPQAQARGFVTDSRILESVFLLSLATSDALHHIFSTRLESVAELVPNALEALISFLQSCQVVEDNVASKLYASILRTITTLVSEAHEGRPNQVSVLMEIIPKFLQYGVRSNLTHSSLHSESTSGFSSDGTDSGYGTRYIPPHQRFSSPRYVGGDFSSSCSSHSFSGSDSTHASTNSRLSDRFRSSRVRLAALSLIQKLCQVDGKSLHQYWSKLLPTRQPLQRSPTTPHLINVLLYDPHPQVRIATSGTISTLMEGRAQKGYIAMAELPDHHKSNIRGFTTLSIRLGHIVLSLHEGLLHAVETEPKLAVIPPLFRCLSSLISSTPYDRMPPDLRLRIVQGIRKRWTSFHGTEDADVAVETSALIALRTVFGTTSAADPEILNYLSQSTSVIHEKTKLVQQVQEFFSESLPVSSTLSSSSSSSSSLNVQSTQMVHSGSHSFLDELLAVAYSDRAIVKSEALSALTSAASKYHQLFRDRWTDIKKILEKNIQFISFEHSSPEEKATQQAIRFLGAQLSSKSESPGQRKHLEIAVELVPIHFVPAISHSSAVIRSATLSEIGGASKQLLDLLPVSVFNDVIHGALHAALEDSVASVRSAACRMIGDLVNFGFFVNDRELFDQIVSALQSCLQCSTISVRISASWSLANVADAVAIADDDFHPLSDDVGGSGLISLSSIAEAAIAASQDHEKVRANGIRALGHLLKKSNSLNSSLNWLPAAITCLEESLQYGGAKVKWNACYAIGSLASNVGIRREVTSDANTLPSLTNLLVHLINENPNFKVQMQAAAAMDNFSEKQFFGETYFPAISAVSRRLHFLQDGSRMMSSGSGSPNTNSSLANESTNGLMDNELMIQQPVIDPSYANFKYHESLKNQLEVTLIHLLSLLDGPFFDQCPFPKPDALFQWMQKKLSHHEELQPKIKEQLSLALRNLTQFENNRQNWHSLLVEL